MRPRPRVLLWVAIAAVVLWAIWMFAPRYPVTEPYQYPSGQPGGLHRAP